jgi:hypothetical protein
MLSDALKFGGAGVVALGLAGCADMAAKSEEPAMMTSDAVGTRVLDGSKPIEAPPQGQLRCRQQTGASIWYQVEGPYQYEWCHFDDNSTSYQFAQRDMYYIPSNGGQQTFGYTALFNCALTQSTIVDAITQNGYDDVCAKQP